MGESFESLAAEGGVHEYAERGYRQYEKEGFNTPSGKVEIFSGRLKKMGYDPSPVRRDMVANPGDGAEPFPLMLTTGGNLLPYTHWQYRYLPRLNKRASEPLLEIHPDTAAAFGISDSDRVEVVTETGTIRIKARLSGTIRPGTLHVAQGWESSNANRLTSVRNSDPISGFPNLKSLRCRVRKITSKTPSSSP